MPDTSYEVSSMNKFSILGIAVTATTMDDVVGHIRAWASDKTGRIVCIREVASLMTSKDDPELIELHAKADIVTPDGMPLVWFGKGKGLKIDRVCGPDLMHEICVVRQGMGLHHFFYGGKEGIADLLVDTLRKQAPDLQIAGTYCPPFRDLTSEEDQLITDRIVSSGADIVWVGISSPKQDIWMWRHKERLPQTMIGVGAAFDFHSGAVPRAPIWMRKRGFEWLFRLASEPRRLWKRYLVIAPKFLILLARDGSLKYLIKGALGAQAS